MLLSVGPFNKWIIKTLQLIRPFSPIDAIPSRLMIYPFSLAILIASLGFDKMFEIFPERIRASIKWSALCILLVILMMHM